MTIFVGGAVVFYTQYRVPANPDMEIYVTGKQWMWKVQHSTGQREINELHVPVGRKIKLTMTTEDVLHDFFIPAFRTKADVVPGRYSTIWFEPTKPGRYHILCAEYCGLNHSGMNGWVTVMEQRDFDNWLGGNVSNQTPAEAGKDLFENKLGCASCHQQNNIGRGPTLTGLYGKPQKLTNGQSVTMDDTYIRNSILNPQAEIVEGYQPIMPTFKGQVNEEQLVQLVAYIKSIGGQNGGATTTTTAPATNTMTNTMNNSSNMSAPNPNSPTMPANRPVNTNMSAPNPNSPTIESNNRATNRNNSGNQQKGAK